MTPSIEVARESEVVRSVAVDTIPLEPAKPKSPASEPGPAPARRFEGSFQSSMLELNRMKSASKIVDFVISLTLNLTLISGPLLAGLYFTDTINMKQFASTFLIAPPPPPPPPPAPAAAVKSPPAHKVFEHSGKLLAPT